MSRLSDNVEGFRTWGKVSLRGVPKVCARLLANMGCSSGAISIRKQKSCGDAKMAYMIIVMMCRYG
eukprot:2065613-Amphidinium_carterae.1